MKTAVGLVFGFHVVVPCLKMSWSWCLVTNHQGSKVVQTSFGQAPGREQLHDEEDRTNPSGLVRFFGYFLPTSAFGSAKADRRIGS